MEIFNVLYSIVMHVRWHVCIWIDFWLTLYEAVGWNTWFSDTWYQLYVLEKSRFAGYLRCLSSLRPSDANLSKKIIIIGSDNALSMPSHYLNQCWNIVNSILRNKIRWNLYIFFIGFHWRKCIWKCEMATILSRPQCVNVHVNVILNLHSSTLVP